MINMRVKELKELLSKFDDNLIVFIPNSFDVDKPDYIELLHASRGINEMDGMLILDDYEEDDEDD